MNDLLDRLAAIVGADGLLVDDTAMAPFLMDWRKRYVGRALAVIRPASTNEVSDVVQACAARQVGIVPQGGNTGLAGGATPDGSGTQVLLSLGRMQRVRNVDPIGNTLTAEAGCTLASIQEAARTAGRLFPLSLAAEGSCTIGGNLATNAGGTAVLRYGNMRELALGLEVVLADGQVWDGLRALHKDNSGYDLKHLFIGSEGTLGIITAAVLKLFPLPYGRATALVTVQSPTAALTLLERLQRRLDARLTGFELISDFCIELVLRHFPDCRFPLDARSPWYALIELTDSEATEQVRETLENALVRAVTDSLIGDAALAASETQAAELWALRENISEAQAREGKNIKHDVSLPLASIVDFIVSADAALAAAFPGVRLVCFGHLGDGNLHFNVSAPAGIEAEAFLANQTTVNRIVHDHVTQYRGSITAEHGVGQLRREELRHYKTPLELDLMRRLKTVLDPLGILNPGKVI